MPHDARAYLADILEACEAIREAIADIDLAAYEGNRLVRSAVEREFIIIGEAMSALSRRASHLFDAIPHARRIIDFRHLLTHEYPSIDDAIVWAIANRDVPLLRRRCETLIAQLDAGDEGP